MNESDVLAVAKNLALDPLLAGEAAPKRVLSMALAYYEEKYGMPFVSSDIDDILVRKEMVIALYAHLRERVRGVEVRRPEFEHAIVTEIAERVDVCDTFRRHDPLRWDQLEDAGPDHALLRLAALTEYLFAVEDRLQEEGLNARHFLALKAQSREQDVTRN